MRSKSKPCIKCEKRLTGTVSGICGWCASAPKRPRGRPRKYPEIPEKAKVEISGPIDLGAKNRWLIKKYGISIGVYTKLVKDQKNLCGICGNPETVIGRGGVPRQLSIDHDHRTNEVRGLLCHSCNLALGHFKDKPFLLLRAARYLQNYATSDEVEPSNQIEGETAPTP